MSLFMCGSKGRRLVISSSYHTNISYILNPLSYNIMYPSWLATSYSCPFFMVSMWSYHWWSKYPFASVSLWEWMYNNPWHSSKYCRNYYFREWSTCLEGCFPHFPRHIWQWIDILITKDGFQTLMDVDIFYLIRTNMMQQTLMMTTHVMMMIVSKKIESYTKRTLGNDFIPLVGVDAH